MSRLRYVIGRTLRSIVLLFLVLSFLFFFFRLMPGEYTDLMLIAGASQEKVDAFRALWGLDRPLYIQYLSYLRNLLTLDAGTSIQYRVPVLEYIGWRIVNSFILVAPGITIAYVIGSIFGTVFGRARGTWKEKYGMIPILITGTIPSFFTAILLVIVFANVVNWFPTSGMVTPGSRAVGINQYLSADFLHHYVLPLSAVVLRYLFLPTLIMRTSVVEVLGQDFIEFHRYTGLSQSRQARHIMRHSILPIITLYPLSMTRSIGGLVLIETVFSWPGIGRALVAGIEARDFPVVQFIFFLMAVFIILSNFVVDLLYGVIDPRVSIEGEED